MSFTVISEQTLFCELGEDDQEAERGASKMSSVVHEDDPNVRVNFLTQLEDSSTPVVMNIFVISST